ncbi:MAG: iron-containing alcohol dehydrogenase [Erysipelotrichaceae bacterium]|nr:iron-containing alcohol dehydrogenase [Erysipelotrichaceae bacterium]
MNNFEINMKTRVIFGKDTHLNVGAEVRKYADSCLIVDDGMPFLKPLTDVVKASLEENGVKWYEFSEITPNPPLTTCRRAMEMIKANGIGFVLAIGGGSTMDAGKFIASQVTTEENLINMSYGWQPEVLVPLPHACISTLSGTGSEADGCAMIVDDTVNPPIKHMVWSLRMCCDFAIINPELTYTLPKKQTAAGGMDIMSHCWETYMVENPNEDLSDYFLAGIVKTVLKYVPICLEDPTNYQARANLCLSANACMNPSFMYSGSANYWICHAMENPITTQFHGTHGQTLGYITLAYVRYCYEHNINTTKLIKWAVECMGAEYDFFEPARTILAGADNLEAWLKKVGLATRLSEVGIDYEKDNDQLRLCAEACVNAGTCRFSVDEVMDIYALVK